MREVDFVEWIIYLPWVCKIRTETLYHISEATHLTSAYHIGNTTISSTICSTTDFPQRDSWSSKDCIVTWPQTQLQSPLSASSLPISPTDGSLVLLCPSTGFVDRGLASSRYNFLGMTIFYPIFLYWGFTRPVPRKLYTDLIADHGQDGEYIRETLRTRKPGLWDKLSKQLYENKFIFKEMNECTVSEFGSGFVNHRVYWSLKHIIIELIKLLLIHHH